ncbi:glycosyl hydrolase [Humibacillus sp. DSM 29435]|uniref:glycoside hydrolase family 3 C-terminal domain-containing protein n=1 Tax=Humibacillus sp. DSM 29435 TaxID=1869167 RepID=UPI0008728712|nr:glycoside hydrolase family 3 C-terminal domain-containing protein [Humibacillus sp. DSM 29435]OFE16218.1 glycosyl hydrolase [Humibacillus sp. DSM 29435]
MTRPESASPERSAAEVVASLTVEQKAALTSGATFWTTKAIEDAGIPQILLTDGPHGVRKQRAGADNLGLTESIPATCFPPAVALGSSFDPALLERVGAALGEEAAALGVAVLLGPGINIKRSPLCGRNFEYLSEDPVVSGVLGAALVRGVQSQGVGASLKHFAANNQEADRMRVSADIDPRPLREIYLRGFQRVVTEAAPWTVMCSYNRLNGVFTSEHPWLLTDVLRGEWGFDGLVMSDWGAVNDRVEGLAAGLDLEMPSSEGRTDAQIVAAVRDGDLDERVLDQAAERVVVLVQRAERRSTPDGFDEQAHHDLAREAAGRSIVLLQNDGDLLPLSPGSSVAVIGAFADTPRYQGAGSSLINPTRLDRAVDAIVGYAGQDRTFFAAGFALTAVEPSEAARLRDEAAQLAGSTEVAVVFLGLPAELESEGFDRNDIELPPQQVELLRAVVAANPRTVVVLSNGGVVRLGDVVDLAPAVLEGWLLGQAGGTAVADVLYGEVNPSGRLAETIPLRLQDTPAHLDFPGEHGHVRYGEGLFVGYRWYDARDLPVQFPFGHGLSYTTFDYGNLTLAAEPDGIRVGLTVANTGGRAGREVVQVYTGRAHSSVARPPRELKGFALVDLAAGESREVEIQVRRDDLAHWDLRVDRWVLEGGDVAVEVGASSRDVRLAGSVTVVGDDVRMPLTLDSSIGEVLADPAAAALVTGALAQADGDRPEGRRAASEGAGAMFSDPALLKMMASAPIGRMVSFPGTGVTKEQVQGLLDQANAEYEATSADDRPAS